MPPNNQLNNTIRDAINDLTDSAAEFRRLRDTLRTINDRFGGARSSDPLSYSAVPTASNGGIRGDIAAWQQYDVQRVVGEQVSRLFVGITDVYLTQMRQIAASPSLSTMQMAAIQSQATGGYYGATLPAIGTAVGAGIGALLGNPFYGAAAGNALGSLAGGYLNNIYNYQATIQQQLGVSQQLASQIGYLRGSTGAGVLGQAYFNATLARQPIANQVGDLYALAISNPVFRSLPPDAFTQLYAATASADFPEGNPGLMALRLQGGLSIAQLYPQHQGGTDAYQRFLGSARIRTDPNPESPEDWWAKTLGHGRRNLVPGGTWEKVRAYDIAHYYPRTIQVSERVPGDYDPYMAALFGDTTAFNQALSDFPAQAQALGLAREEYVMQGQMTALTARIAGADVASYQALLAGGTNLQGLRQAGAYALSELNLSAQAPLARLQNLQRRFNPNNLPLQELALTNPTAANALAEAQQEYGGRQMAAALFGRENTFQQIGMVQTHLQAIGIKGEVGVQQALFGGNLETIAGAYQQQVLNAQQAQASYLALSKLPGLSEAQRELYGGLAGQAGYQANTLLPMTGELSRFSLVQSGIEAQRAYAGAQVAYGAAYGTAGAVYQGHQGEIAALQQDLSNLWQTITSGKLGAQELNRAWAQLNDTQRRLVESSARAVDEYNRIQNTVADLGRGITGTRAERAFLTGRGGIEGLGYVQADIGAAREVASTRYQSLLNVYNDIKQNNPGLTDAEILKNPRYLEALHQYEQAQTGVAASILNQASVPFAAGEENRYRQAQFTADVLQSLPGAYGNLRGALQGVYTGSQNRVAQLQQMKAQALEGITDPGQRDEIALRFDERIRQETMTGVRAFNQLSYGWEARLISNVMGASGNFSGVGNRFSYMASVLGGVTNPHFGANASQLPFFLEQAGYAGSLAGATGTPQGFAATALAGQGQRQMPVQEHHITVTLEWPDGSQAGQFTLNTGKGGGNVMGQFEDMANRFVLQNQGNN